MPATALSLMDLIPPCQLLGTTLGDWQVALGAIYVDHYEATGSAKANTIRGVAKFAVLARSVLDLPNARFTITAVAGGVHPQDDPTRRDPWIDIQDAQIAFEFFAPRIGSPIIAGAAGIPAPAQNVFNVVDALPTDLPSSDYPAAQFTLDMLLTTVVLRPADAEGRDTARRRLARTRRAYPLVPFSLPYLRMQLS